MRRPARSKRGADIAIWGEQARGDTAAFVHLARIRTGGTTGFCLARLCPGRGDFRRIRGDVSLLEYLATAQ